MLGGVGVGAMATVVVVKAARAVVVLGTVVFGGKDGMGTVIFEGNVKGKVVGIRAEFF